MREDECQTVRFQDSLKQIKETSEGLVMKTIKGHHWREILSIIVHNFGVKLLKMSVTDPVLQFYKQEK